jgi:ElaB/YqjD/DUF883 family membrane-anchored ribosome-binding protein
MSDVETTETEVSLNKLVSDFKIVVHDAEALLKATAGELGEKAREARTRLTASLTNCKSSLQVVEDKAIAGAKAADKVIREHPYQSIGLSFGVGMLIGVLVSRK